MSGLPRGWIATTIGEICDLVNGRAFKPTDWSSTGLPIVRIQNLNREDREYNFFDGDVDERFLVQRGELLFAWSGTPGTSFGAHIWKGPLAVLNQHIFKIGFDRKIIDTAFFRHAINQTLDEQIAKAHGGVGLRHVTKGEFENTPLSLPPLCEQRRIAAKVDSLASKSRRAREHLDHIPRLVEKYKQAILAAAFRGDLTKEWRRNAKERGAWAVHTLGSLVSDGPANGWSPQSGQDATGALTLKLTATTSGYLRLDDAAVKRIYEVPSVNSKYWLRPGDLLIQRANAIDHVGASAIFEGPDHTYIYPDLMMRVRIADETLRRLIWRYLNCSGARAYFRENATGTSGNMPKISSATLKGLKVPLPNSPRERQQTLLRIETAFAWIDRLAANASSARKLVDTLEQGVLAKAFRGELVPQDPTEEPTSALLDRIRAERAAKPKAKRGRKPGARP